MENSNRNNITLEKGQIILDKSSLYILIISIILILFSSIFLQFLLIDRDIAIDKLNNTIIDLQKN